VTATAYSGDPACKADLQITRREKGSGTPFVRPEALDVPDVGNLELRERPQQRRHFTDDRGKPTPPPGAGRHTLRNYANVLHCTLPFRDAYPAAKAT